jgi:multimeric flavodoxin WrbA
MNLCILDAAPYQRPVAALARRSLADLAQARGWGLQTLFLPGMAIADCAGDFNCWVRTPGTCSIKDANHDVARAVMASDVTVFLTPLAFGGYSSELKKAVDHFIQLITPYFETVRGESHHTPRYASYPALAGVGLVEEPSDEATRIFRTLVARNALNMQHTKAAADVLHPGMDADRVREVVWGTVLDALGDEAAAPAAGASRRVDGVEAACTLPLGVEPGDWAAPRPAPQSAVLLAGSPRGGHSSSTVLGQALLTRLQARGVSSQVIQVSAAQRAPGGLDRLAEAVDGADLVVLSHPLYVDSLPAPVIRALEHLAASRRSHPPKAGQRFVAIVQSGFPEAHQNHVAAAIGRRFAREAGFVWAGSLPMGAGGMIDGQSLERLGGRAAHIVKALDLAAAALAAGGPVPNEAAALMATPSIPHWAYRLIADGLFRWTGWKRGLSRRMRDRPFQRQDGPAA